MRFVEALIIGAGPAGLAAAIEMCKAGVKPVVLDENDRPGGQLTKQIHKFFGSKAHSAGTRGFNIGEQLLEEAIAAGAEIHLGSVVYGIFPNETHLYPNAFPSESTKDRMVIGSVNESGITTWATRRLLIATGALENALAFPGWDLPGVMGAGCAQTMINIHRVLPGGSALMVGSGNVGLIVSYQMLQAGMEVRGVVEAAPKIGGYEVHANKIRRYGVPILTSHTVVEARGNDKVEEVVISKVDESYNPVSNTEKTLQADVLCIAVGLNPLIELAQMAGCNLDYVPELGGYIPIHGDDMQTIIPGIYVAGDVAGVQEASCAMDEGRLAGISIAESLGALDLSEAQTRKTITRRRLSQLQSGPFGDGRKSAKKSIHEKYKTLRGERS